MSKFTISQPQKPVSADQVKTKYAPRSDFSVNMAAMNVGQAILVDGMSKGNLTSRVNSFSVRNPERKYTVQSLVDGRHQVTRDK